MPQPVSDPSAEPPALLPHHRRVLAASGIGDDVIAARGYRSVETLSELERLGFGRAARIVPTLLVPIFSCLTGEVSLYHHRPDHPRMRKGKVAKYEFPHGASMAVDVHPFLREMVRDPAAPLWITEGVKKADAAITQGLCCLAVPGVWNWRGTNEWGGKTALPDWEGVALKGESGKGRRVFLCFDSDVMRKREVYLALQRFGAFLSGRGADVWYVYLPDGERGAKVGLDDFLAAGGTVEQMEGAAARTLREPPAGEGDAPTDEEYARNDGGLPCIETSRRHLRHTTQDTLAALARANEPPRLFVHGGQLARVAVDENDSPAVQPLTLAALRGLAAHAANFVQAGERGVYAVPPPPSVIESIHALDAWPMVPALTGIVTAPVALDDRTILTAAGYHAGARLYHHSPKGFSMNFLPPTPANVAASRALLEDVLADFPFADAGSRAAAWGLLLLPFVRPLIGGPTPLHLIDAPQAGTGKSLLASVCTDLFMPQGAALTSCPPTEEEWGKTITSVLMSGASHLIIDNARKLDSGKLFAALTTTIWKDRQMGGNDMLPLVNRLVWVATCNNVAGGDELTRRSVWVRLDAGVEQPDARRGWRHADLRGHARQNRGALVGAALTLIAAWQDANCPSYEGPLPPLGSFEGWTSVMGGLLQHIGIDGFLGNRDALRSRVDKDTSAWSGFVDAWWELYGAAAVSAGDLAGLAAEWFAERLGDGGEKGQKVRLGRLLGSHLDRVYGGRKITNGGKVASGPSKGAAAYALVQITSAAGQIAVPAADLDPATFPNSGKVGKVGKVVPSDSVSEGVGVYPPSGPPANPSPDPPAGDENQEWEAL